MKRMRPVAMSTFTFVPYASGNASAMFAAIVSSGDRTAELRQIDAPTLVIHGDRDRMVHPSGGAATADAIPGARLETITGMGHDLPRLAWPRLVSLISDHINQETRRAQSG